VLNRYNNKTDWKKNMCLSEEQDEIIDKLKDRMTRGVSTERLINNVEVREIGRAVIELRDQNVELANALLQLSKRYDEVFALTQGKILNHTTP
jgi:phosphoenolpyruvate synthase/pyruvate phosphate dikinase